MEEIDKVVELDLGYTPEAAISGAVLVQTEQSTFLTFNAMRKVGQRREPAGSALVEFPFCQCTLFGYPNDEALPGHPLYSNGLDSGGYGIYEVLNPSWPKRLEAQNRVVFPDAAPYSSPRHFIITFHDNTFECLADDIVLEVIDEPYEQVFARIAKRVLAE